MPYKKEMKYAIITPAHNEVGLISYTLETVISQSILPVCWVVVNDGSTDGTGEIVESYLKKYDFIQLVNLERNGARNFARKAIAFGHGAKEIRHLDYEFIGNLDADISLEKDYYEAMINEFISDSNLGIAGGKVYTKIRKGYYSTDNTIESVAGAVQLFRRTCYEAVGGYTPLKYGGIDAAAEIKAKMLGWKVLKFPNHVVLENRRTGTAQASPLKAKLREGQRFYSLGYGFPLYLLRSLYRIQDPPFLLGSMAALYGFTESLIRRHPVLLSSDAVKYWKTEHLRHLRETSQRIVKLGRYIKQLFIGT